MLNSVNSRLDSLDSHSSNSASESNTYEAAKSIRIMDLYQQPLDLSLKRSSTSSVTNKICSKKMRNNKDIVRSGKFNEASIGKNHKEANHLVNIKNSNQTFDPLSVDSYINLNRLAQNIPVLSFNDKPNELANLLAQPASNNFVIDYNNNQTSLNQVHFNPKDASQRVKTRERQKKFTNKRLKSNTQRKERKASLDINTLKNNQVINSYKTTNINQTKELNQYKEVLTNHCYSNSQGLHNNAMRFAQRNSNSSVSSSNSRKYQVGSSFYNQTNNANSYHYSRELNTNNLPAKSVNIDLTKNKNFNRFQENATVSSQVHETNKLINSNCGSLHHNATKQIRTHSRKNNFQHEPRIVFNSNIPQTSVPHSEFLEAALKQNLIPNGNGINRSQALGSKESSVSKKQTHDLRNSNLSKNGLSSYPKVQSSNNFNKISQLRINQNKKIDDMIHKNKTFFPHQRNNVEIMRKYTPSNFYNVPPPYNMLNEAHNFVQSQSKYYNVWNKVAEVAHIRSSSQDSLLFQHKSAINQMQVDNNDKNRKNKYIPKNPLTYKNHTKDICNTNLRPSNKNQKLNTSKSSFQANKACSNISKEANLQTQQTRYQAPNKITSSSQDYSLTPYQLDELKRSIEIQIEMELAADRCMKEKNKANHQNIKTSLTKSILSFLLIVYLKLLKQGSLFGFKT